MVYEGRYLLDGQTVVPVKRRDADPSTIRDAFLAHEYEGARQTAVEWAPQGGALARGASHAFM